MGKNTKMKCPFCAEYIRFDAKKCRFCSEWLPVKHAEITAKESKVPKPGKYFAVWFVSMIIFLLALLINGNDTSKVNNYVAGIITADVIVGLLSFLCTIVETLNAIINKKSRYTGIFYCLITIISFCLFFYGFSQISSKNASPAPQAVVPPTPIPLICPEGKIVCYWNHPAGECVTQAECKRRMNVKNTPTTNNVTSTTKVINTNTSDPPVHCQIDAKCGGGTTPLKKSECDKSACCLIDGSYKFTKDSSLCQDTIIKCNVHTNCGGGVKEMRRIDCQNITCCQVNGTWVLRDKGTCNSEQKAQTSSEWYSFCDKLWPDRYEYPSYMDGYTKCLNNNPANK